MSAADSLLKRTFSWSVAVSHGSCLREETMMVGELTTTDIRAPQASFLIRFGEEKTASGKVGNLLLVFHFSAPRRSCGNVGIAAFAISKDLWTPVGNLPLVFLGVHRPSFPQPFCLMHSSSAELRPTSFVWLVACSAPLPYRFLLSPFVLTPAP